MTTLPLLDTFTSTGSKLLWHTEAMEGLRAGAPRVVTAHVMPTDRCGHKCAFCSVGQRAGDVLPMRVVLGFIDALLRHGLKAVIVSGGGNPILYRCPENGTDFNGLIDAIYDRELEIGLITDGMPLKKYEYDWSNLHGVYRFRRSWKAVAPATLDKLTWVRVSMAGLDHDERRVDVPDVDPERTTLGLSYVAHDIWYAPEEPHHGKVSTPADLLALGADPFEVGRRAWFFEDRIEALTEQILDCVWAHHPRYLRLLPNCLEPALIPRRCEQLGLMARAINQAAGYEVAFVQHKPPRAPQHCWNGYVHPTLAPDGYVYSCDSVVLAAADIGYKAGAPNHKFDNPWRLCRWDEVEDRLFVQPVRSLVDSQRLCAGCVFANQQAILEGVVDGSLDLTPPEFEPEHSAFI